MLLLVRSASEHLMRGRYNQVGAVTDGHTCVDHTGMDADHMLEQRTSTAEIAHGLKIQRGTAAHTQD